MAISDLVSALQAVESSVDTRLSIVGVSIPISGTSTILGVKDSIEDRILGIDDTQSSISSKLSDLESLRTKLLTLSTAAARVKNLPATRYDGAIDLTGSSLTNDTVDFDDTELTAAGLTLKTGDAIVITGGASAGVSADTTYYINADGTDTNPPDVTVQLYTSRRAAVSADASGLVDITANAWNNGVGRVVISDVDQTDVEDVFDAFNEVQSFLEEITGDDGSLEGEDALSKLGQQLTNAMWGFMTDSNLLPLVEDSSDTRELTLDSDALTTLLTTKSNNVAAAFETSTGAAGLLQNVVSNYAGASGVINQVIDSVQTTVRDSDTDVGGLLAQAQHDQLASVNTIASIAGSITVSTKQIDFLKALFE